MTTRKTAACSTRIVVGGRLDRAGGACLSKSVIDVLRRLRPGRIVLDLADVTMLDTAGVSALLVGHADAAQVDCGVVLLNPRPSVHWTLWQFGLLARFGLAEPLPLPRPPPLGPAVIPSARAGRSARQGAES